MSGPIRPTGTAWTAPGTELAWLVVAGCGVFALAAGVVTTATAVAEWLSGRGWSWQPSWALLADAVRGDAPTTAPPTLWWAALGVVSLAVLTPLAAMVVAVQRHRRRVHDPASALARPADLVEHTPQQLDRQVRRLRPSLVGRRKVDLTDLGMHMGDLQPGSTPYMASWEDVVLMFAGSRSQKTTGLAVPLVLDAPGPVLATSNRSDLFTSTIRLRQQVGTCWVFDPQGIAYTHQGMWWNPLRYVTTVEAARRLAGHFMQEVSGERSKSDSDFWLSAGLGLLASMLLAAGLTGRTLRDVWRWLSDSTDDTPFDLLTQAGSDLTAIGLQGRMRGAHETREGIYENARTAAQCLESETIMAWVTPPRAASIVEFDPTHFPTSCDTLYLMSKDQVGAAQPLVAALVDQVLDAAIRIGESAGGRMDPPLLPMLDEAANICKIRDLPQLYSHLGGRGITPITILQSFRQGTSVWGEIGMDMLWSTATVKIVSAGMDDPRFAEDLSRLVGMRDVTVTSHTRDSRGGGSENSSVRQQRILEPSDVRALPRGTALVLATGNKPARINLRPWFRNHPRSTEIADSARAEVDALAQRAQHWPTPTRQPV